MKPIIRSFLLFVPLMLAACSDGSMRDTLGLNRRAPDEFTVVSRPPLSVPPEFDLRPPQPGAAPRGPSANEQAREVILGKPANSLPDINSLTESSVPTAVTPVITSDAPSEGAASFLKRAGTDAADEDIRSKLGHDAVTPADNSKAKSLYEKLVGADKAEPVVDPKKEAERLRDNIEAGKPVNEGDVPVEETKPPSVIDRIF